MKITFMTVLLLGLIPVAVPAGPLQKPEDALRDRVHDFTQALLKEKYDDALAFVDPDIVKEWGADKVKDTGKHIMNYIRALNEAWFRKLTGFHIRKVEFLKDKNMAVVDLYYYTGTKSGGAWRQEYPGDQHWVLKKGVWYWTYKEP